MSLIVISNTTPIITLCCVNHEFVLKELFQHVIIPRAVELELKSSDKPGSKFMKQDWVQVKTPENDDIVHFLKKDLDPGEAETIALAQSMMADIVIIDERAGYQIAKHFDLPVIRTLSILKTAKNRGIVGEIRPIVEAMREKGRWFSNAVIEKFLSDVGEI